MLLFGTECFAAVFLALFLLLKKHLSRFPRSSKTNICGLINHCWIFFSMRYMFQNVSITLSVFFVRSFCFNFRALFYGRKVLWYEVFFGLIIIAGLAMIMNVEVNYFAGMYALVSIILGVLFTLMNGKLIEKHNSAVISFYEFLGSIFISIY
jgi:hypothetical protein